MKRINLWMILGLLFATSQVLVSCGDEEPGGPDGGEGNTEIPGGGDEPDVPGGGGDNTPSTDEEMSPSQQKEYLEAVALDFMRMTPASDFQEISDLCQHIDEVYGDEYEWDNVGDWAENTFENLKSYLGKSTETERDEYYGSVYNTYYTDYKAVLMASNFTGHFTAQNNKWDYSEAKDLQFIFRDQNGQKCILKVETSGKTKKVHMYNAEDWTDYDGDYDNNGNWISNEYYDRIQLTIGVPEKIVVSLSQGGSDVINAVINTDLSGIDGEKFDLSRNSLSMSSVVTLNNGYTFDLSQAAYKGNVKAASTCTIKKSGKTMVSLAVSSDLSGIPSCNLDAFAGDDYDEDDFDNANAKNAYVKLDILGRVQIQGTISQVREFVNYMDRAESNDNNEREFKSNVNLANSLMNLNLFYDGKSTKQAEVRLEAFEEENWDGERYWETEPVLYFKDGTSYSTFEAFFNDVDFKSVIDMFEELLDNYEELFPDDEAYDENGGYGY